MQPPCVREVSQVCSSGCCVPPFLTSFESAGHSAAATAAVSTARATRANFVAATTAVLFPNTHFTNCESLPSLPEAYAGFTAAYPQYQETEKADRIREREYGHLSDHICLDYTGVGLFSHAQLHSSPAPSPPPASPPRAFPQTRVPCFTISYKSASLRAQLQQGNHGCAAEAGIRDRIMGFLNIFEDDYGMVCTANRACAFKLLAESYPFQTHKRLLSVYDWENEEVSGMAESSLRRGAKVMSANFSWPSLRINAAKLNQLITSKRKKKRRGLFVFPLQSSVSGARYSYLWMRLARENGWHVLLDACALGPKDLDALGLSLIQPDFIVCSFFKVLGENPSGFAGLFVRRSFCSILESNMISRSIGIVSILPERILSHNRSDCSHADSDAQTADVQVDEGCMKTAGSSSGPVSRQLLDGSSSGNEQKYLSLEHKQLDGCGQGEGSIQNEMEISEEPESSDGVESRKTDSVVNKDDKSEVMSMDIECRGLDHADSLGLVLITSRLRYITNWLVNALTKLHHPNSENGHHLVRLYGPRIKFDRGPTVAFNVFDWKGEKIEPALVQKLADRSNISLNCGFLQNIFFSPKYEDQKDVVLERKITEVANANRKRERIHTGVSVVNASLCFLANFEDAYKLWAFVAKFLDADFVERERWRYMTLNQKVVEV